MRRLCPGLRSETNRGASLTVDIRRLAGMTSRKLKVIGSVLLTAVLLIWFAWCWVWSIPVSVSTLKKLTPGMSQAQVYAILGPATQTNQASNAEIWWTYQHFPSFVELSAGRRPWVLVKPCDIGVQIRSVPCDSGATLSTPGNSTVDFLSTFRLWPCASTLMGRRHRVIGHWFESSM